MRLDLDIVLVHDLDLLAAVRQCRVFFQIALVELHAFYALAFFCVAYLTRKSCADALQAIARQMSGGISPDKSQVLDMFLVLASDGIGTVVVTLSLLGVEDPIQRLILL